MFLYKRCVSQSTSDKYKISYSGKIKNISRKKRKVKRFFKDIYVFLFLSCFLGFSANILQKPDFSYDFKEIDRDLNFFVDLNSFESKRDSVLTKIKNIAHKYTKSNDECFNIIAKTIYEMSIKYPNLDPEMICAVIAHESSWNDNAKSISGAKGMMQIIRSTAEVLAEEEGIQYANLDSILYNPELNIKLGCRYLSTLVEDYGKEGGLVGYNAGPRYASLYVRNGTIGPLETQGYVPRVINTYKKYKNL